MQAFKYARAPDGGKIAIVELVIPLDALTNLNRKVHDKNFAKYRANKAGVRQITLLETGELIEQAVSGYDKTFVYRTGCTMEVKDFNTDIETVCAPGIHFFLCRDAAVFYAYEYVPGQNPSGLRVRYDDDGKLRGIDFRNEVFGFHYSTDYVSFGCKQVNTHQGIYKTVQQDDDSAKGQDSFNHGYWRGIRVAAAAGAAGIILGAIASVVSKKN